MGFLSACIVNWVTSRITPRVGSCMRPHAKSYLHGWDPSETLWWAMSLRVSVWNTVEKAVRDLQGQATLFTPVLRCRQTEPSSACPKRLTHRPKLSPFQATPRVGSETGGNKTDATEPQGGALTASGTLPPSGHRSSLKPLLWATGQGGHMLPVEQEPSPMDGCLQPLLLRLITNAQ